jgi:16S rRNA (guanine527-N7)-methyltransferase
MPLLSSLPLPTQALFDQFAQLLITASQEMNLTAVTDLEGIRVRHFEDSLAALPTLEAFRAEQKLNTVRLLDIGSGAGFPGLALALAAPWLRVTSLEATGKKVRFQQSIIDALGLTNATVLQDRAEDLGHDAPHRDRYDIVTARAFAPLPILAELTLPFVHPGGLLLAWKGARLPEELAEAKLILSILGAGAPQEIAYTLPGIAEAESHFRIVVFPKKKRTPPTYPRPMSKIKKSGK